MNADLESVIKHLETARVHAVNAGLDYHFVSDVEHLIATAKHNLDDKETTSL